MSRIYTPFLIYAPLTFSAKVFQVEYVNYRYCNQFVHIKNEIILIMILFMQIKQNCRLSESVMADVGNGGA